MEQSEPTTEPRPAATSDRAANARASTWLLGILVALAVVAMAAFVFSRGGAASVAALSGTPGHDVKALQQALATAQKSDEVSRVAIRKLQEDLSEREAEIATLKEDLAFYERFVGTAAQRQPLGIEELRLSQRSAGVWQFAAVVARSSASNAEITGRLSFSVEGTQDSQLKKLAWSDLRKGAGADGIAFSLKYFQRLGGDFLLPPGFTPTRITARLAPQQGPVVENSFAWKDVAH